LKDFLEVENLIEAVDKKVLLIANNSDIFALLNLENNNFFSIKAKFFPENYKRELEEIINEPGNE
jgi:hypothetical protein